jgi:retinol dehydrogenase-13
MAKTVLITGCNSGIGLETAKELASKGFNLILICRSQEKLNILHTELAQLNSNIKIAGYVCDLADLAQVQATAKQIATEQPDIDIVINNAGIWDSKHLSSTDGFELTWTVNYFAVFILTQHLLPILKNRAEQTHDVRIINVGSEAHRTGRINFADFTKFQLQSTYSSTKLADVMYTFKLARMLKGSGITVNTLHPGVVATGLWRVLPGPLKWITNLFLISAKEGAQTTIYLATLPELTETGKYYSKSTLAKPTKYSLDEKLQDELYTHTTEILAKYLN